MSCIGTVPAVYHSSATLVVYKSTRTVSVLFECSCHCRNRSNTILQFRTCVVPVSYRCGTMVAPVSCQCRGSAVPLRCQESPKCDPGEPISERNSGRPSLRTSSKSWETARSTCFGCPDELTALLLSIYSFLLILGEVDTQRQALVRCVARHICVCDPPGTGSCLSRRRPRWRTRSPRASPTCTTSASSTAISRRDAPATLDVVAHAEPCSFRRRLSVITSFASAVPLSRMHLPRVSCSRP